MQLTYRFGFDAAHHFDAYPEGHPYRGVHGHSFQVEIALGREPDPATGFVTDFARIERAASEVRQPLPDRAFNDIAGLSDPSRENPSARIWHALPGRFPNLPSV